MNHGTFENPKLLFFNHIYCFLNSVNSANLTGLLSVFVMLMKVDPLGDHQEGSVKKVASEELLCHHHNGHNLPHAIEC